MVVPQRAHTVFLAPWSSAAASSASGRRAAVLGGVGDTARVADTAEHRGSPAARQLRGRVPSKQHARVVVLRLGPRPHAWPAGLPWERVAGRL